MAIPLELALHIFSYLDLKSLVMTRSTCSFWRESIQFADIDPTRRELLKLYLYLVHRKRFLSSRHTEKALPPLDRKKYLSSLSSQLRGTPLPASFEMYILEWPERAIVNVMWPTSMPSGITPQLHPIPVFDMTPSTGKCEPLHNVLCLLLTKDRWLVMDPQNELYGRVLKTSEQGSYTVMSTRRGSDLDWRERMGKPTKIKRDNVQMYEWMKKESQQLPFLDWLWVGFQRMCSTTTGPFSPPPSKVNAAGMFPGAPSELELGEVLDRFINRWKPCVVQEGIRGRCRLLC